MSEIKKRKNVLEEGDKMPYFSDKSKERLSTCEIHLQTVFNEIIKHFDCTILEGHRGREKQNEYFDKGTSKLRYPNGNHNSFPSTAVDAAPYPYPKINSDDKREVRKELDRIFYFSGFVMGVATRFGIELRWGGDWDRDKMLSDQKWDDLFHFEIHNK